eukprot:TRINITY_DN21039_c0_g1_i1.p1 TRINITY_DN21039_c0_g1~~TRINITY_DN21039_c0_g1_i1.p1  ORF type:complete len:148 (-),score=7.97 TRINITY_DN21039_c0_g1_i1:343-786(-)
MFPEILCDLPLSAAWGFKFDDHLQTGVSLHADAAAVNVNLWITPDEYNLDGTTGGLVIYDAVAPSDLTFAQYNTDNYMSTEGRKQLDEYGWRNITVPYRQNRVILFDSARYHTTQELSFRPGFLSRRINLTFLFGIRGSYCPMKRSM